MTFRTYPLLLLFLGLALESAGAQTQTVPIFCEAKVHFLPDSGGKYASPGVVPSDNGRILTSVVELPRWERGMRIMAHLVIAPIPKDDRSVHDRWDRAGNFRLALDGQADLEVVRFMTAYGGRTEHEVDVSHLWSVLQGRRTFRVFIDTWVSPAWTFSAELRYEADSTLDNADWVQPVFYTDSFNSQDMPAGVDVGVTIPDSLARVALTYVSTGHCTDGTDADEFISKANVIAVDSHVVARVHPWRTDCRRYRERNPYTTRWSDGTWSSDYSRSGWCPGCEVRPLEFDLTDALTAGAHRVHFRIEKMRPRDAEGNYGYWRVSGYLLGWKREPRLWQN